MGLVTLTFTYLQGSQNHLMSWVGRDLKIFSSDPPAMHRDSFPQIRILRAPSKVITEAPPGAGGEKPPCPMCISLYPQTEVKDKGIQLHGGAFIYSGNLKKTD